MKSLLLCYSLIEMNRNTLTEITITARYCPVMKRGPTPEDMTSLLFYLTQCDLNIKRLFLLCILLFICKSLIMGYRLTKSNEHIFHIYSVLTAIIGIIHDSYNYKSYWKKLYCLYHSFSQTINFAEVEGSYVSNFYIVDFRCLLFL